MFGSVCCGIVLDKTHRFKYIYKFVIYIEFIYYSIFFILIYIFLCCTRRETTLAVYAFSMIGMWIYTFTLNAGHIAIVYVTSSLLGYVIYYSNWFLFFFIYVYAGSIWSDVSHFDSLH